MNYQVLGCLQVILFVIGIRHGIAFGDADDNLRSLPELYNRKLIPFGANDETKVEFLLFTKETLTSPKISKIDSDGTLFNGTMDVTKDTKVIIHGWLDNWRSLYSQTMIKSFIPKYNVNVIVVYWPEAETVILPYARYKVPVVGRIVAKFLERLAKESGLTMSSVHIIGHSLGAHVAGVAGKNLVTAHVGRITGLDPAKPLFSIDGDDTLNRKAASFVDIVHTCGNYYGLFDALGHVDYYPNGGVPNQPGCPFDLGKCSHQRSYLYYAESIVNSTSFLATECDDWETYLDHGCDNNLKIFMNANTISCARGKFFFHTATSSPFGLGLKS